jgi:hypothetical protein
VKQADPPRPMRRMYGYSVSALDLASPRRASGPMFPPPPTLASTSSVARIAAQSPDPPAGKPSGRPVAADIHFVFYQPEVPVTASTGSSAPSRNAIEELGYNDITIFPQGPPPRNPSPQRHRLKRTPTWVPRDHGDVIRNEYGRGCSANERKTRDTRKERQVCTN